MDIETQVSDVIREHLAGAAMSSPVVTSVEAFIRRLSAQLGDLFEDEVRRIGGHECPAGGPHNFIRITGERSVGIPDCVLCDECGAGPTDSPPAVHIEYVATDQEAGW